jgi:GNAT superfamily N-acetyltransferase
MIADLSSGELGGWVAEEDGRIVAFSMAYRDEDRVFALFTLPAFERKGYGTRLLDEALTFLKDHGHSRVSLSTARGTAAERFYLSRGWTVIGDDSDCSEDVLFEIALGR